MIDADGILEPMGFKELQADQKVVDGCGVSVRDGRDYRQLV